MFYCVGLKKIKINVRKIILTHFSLISLFSLLTSKTRFCCTTWTTNVTLNFEAQLVAVNCTSPRHLMFYVHILHSSSICGRDTKLKFAFYWNLKLWIQKKTDDNWFHRLSRSNSVNLLSSLNMHKQIPINYMVIESRLTQNSRENFRGRRWKFMILWNNSQKLTEPMGIT